MTTYQSFWLEGKKIPFGPSCLQNGMGEAAHEKNGTKTPTTFLSRYNC
jgi:hypothetical protein